MTNFSHGREAEKVAVNYLKQHGYKILSTNWRTRYCEIDIVALNNGTVHFVEVKYRQSDIQGSGLEYITANKLKQMTFAAQMWVNDNGWKGDITLSAIEVAGPDYTISEFLPAIEGNS